MGRVGVAVDVDLDGGVDGDEAQTTDDFGVVRNLRRTQHEFVLEEVDVVVDALQIFVGHAERAGRGALHTSVAHEVDDGVLQHFGIDVEGGDFGVLTEGAEDGVGRRAHTALERQERLRDDAALHFRKQEFGHALTNLVGHGVGILERASLVWDVALDHADHLRGVELEVGRTDAVVGVEDGDGFAQRRILRFIDVVDADRLR